MHPTSCILIIYLREIINLFISRLRGRKEKPKWFKLHKFQIWIFLFFLLVFCGILCSWSSCSFISVNLYFFLFSLGMLILMNIKQRKKQKLTATYTFLLTSKHCFISVLHSCQYYGWRKQRCLCSYEWFGFGETSFSSRTCRVCMFYYS